MAPRKLRERKRQTKINFSPASKSSPASATSPIANMGNEASRPTQLDPIKVTKLSSLTKQSRIAVPRPNMPTKRTRLNSSSEDELAAETERGMRLGIPVKSTPYGIFGSSDADPVSSADSESSVEEKQHIVQPKSRKRRRSSTDNDDDSGDNEPAVAVVPMKRQRRTKVEIASSYKEEASRSKNKGSKGRDAPDGEALRTPPRKTRQKLIRNRSSTSEDEEDVVRVAPRRQIPSRRKSLSEEEIEKRPSPRNTRRRLKRRATESDEEDMSGKDIVDRNNDSEEQEELKEDLAFLRSSPLPDRGRLRSTHEKPKSERQKALEALKRRRTGTNEPSSSATPSRKKQVVVHSESESELEVIKEEPDSDAQVEDDGDDNIEDDEDESEGARDANRLDMFQEDAYDESFIDHDADSTIGEPGADLDELRVALGLSRAKPRDLFKHAVEWMVKKKIHPGFESTKNIYTFTFRKLDDEVKALAGSKYTSSAWTPDFTRAIKARPNLMLSELTNSMREVMMPHCAACNRRSHPASWELMLSGDPYHEETLEPIEQSSESDDSDDSDDSNDSDISADSELQLNGEKPSYNAKGERLVPESHRFFLGSTCKANAQVSHPLYHWRYHLYSWVKDYLVSKGYLTAEMLVRRDGRSDRKREKEAHKIVDAMEADGEIRKLYKAYKDQVTYAVEADNDYNRGWGRRQR